MSGRPTLSKFLSVKTKRGPWRAQDGVSEAVAWQALDLRMTTETVSHDLRGFDVAVRRSERSYYISCGEYIVLN